MRNDSKYFLSIDVGTSSVKAALFDVSGSLIALASEEYSLYTPDEGIVELHPETYWNCCVKGIGQVVSNVGIEIANRICSIGVCSQGETLITLGEKWEPLRNAIVWIDSRSGQEATELMAEFGVNQSTGQSEVSAMWPVTKILWLKKHEPEVFAKCRKFVLVEDYIIFRLSGRFVGTYSLYTSSYMLDIRKKCWWQEILAYVGISDEQLVALEESGYIVDTVSQSVAHDLGLSPKTVVVTGAMDQTAGLIGAGAIEDGVVTETIGSALVVCQTTGAFPDSLSRSFPIHYHAIADMYFLISFCSSAGLSFKWLRDTFFENESQLAEKTGEDPYNLLTALAETIPAGSEGLLFFPFMSGPGTLAVDPTVRGVYYGIQMHQGRGHFIRAMMESIAFVIRESLEEMATIGVSHTEIRSLGGGARSGLWNQIKADVLGHSISTMECPEAAALGTAVLQAVALGQYPNIAAAVGEMVHVAQKIDPDSASASMYKEAYEYYRSIEKKYFAT